VTVAFNDTGKRGDPPTFTGVRLYRYDIPVGKGPTPVGWQGKDGRQTVVLAGKQYAFAPALVDRQENGTLAVSRAAGGRVRLTGIYHYGGLLFVVDETVMAETGILLEAGGDARTGGTAVGGPGPAREGAVTDDERPPPAKAADAPGPEREGEITAWGKPVRGLQAGIRCRKDKQVIRPGERSGF